MVVAVPMSMTIHGKPYSSAAATASTIRSAPTWAGLSTRISSPVLTPAPTTNASQSVTFFTASFRIFVSGGTTDEMIAPSILFPETPCSSMIVFRRTAYSSSVFVLSVDTRSVK